MTSLLDDRFQALGEPWAREADIRLSIRARAQRRLAEWAIAASDEPAEDTRGTVRRLLKAGFAPEGEAAFLRAVAAETGADPVDLGRRLEDYAGEAAAEAEAEASRS
ncbi:ATPase inhibitor subunit zeta [Palleronia sp.]|uniref:ATPase inhibitor subunit zeta n=1 Tax=Palleronia sp. TaxID=1940284 RepID=UPI0035C7A06E